MEFVKNLQSFLQLYNKYLINQACSGPYWENIGPRSFLYGPSAARSVLSNSRADILPVRPSRLVNKIVWSIKDLLHGIKSTEKMIFVLVYFPALKRKPVICKSDNAFRFSRSLVPSGQKNHRKSFYCHGKYFAKENFRAPAWTLAKCYCGNETGNPERAVSLHLARSRTLPYIYIYFVTKIRRNCAA